MFKSNKSWMCMGSRSSWRQLGHRWRRWQAARTSNNGRAYNETCL